MRESSRIRLSEIKSWLNCIMVKTVLNNLVILPVKISSDTQSVQKALFSGIDTD